MQKYTLLLIISSEGSIMSSTIFKKYHESIKFDGV